MSEAQSSFDAAQSQLSDAEIASHFETDDYEMLISALSDLKSRSWEGIKFTVEDPENPKKTYDDIAPVDHLIYIARNIPLIAKGKLDELDNGIANAALGLVPNDAYGFRDCVKKCIEKEIARLKDGENHEENGN